MHLADFGEAVGAFTVWLTHVFVPVKSVVETLMTMAEDTINNTNCSNDLNWFFFFFFFFVIGVAELL